MWGKCCTINSCSKKDLSCSHVSFILELLNYRRLHYDLCVSAAKPATPESRSPGGSINKPDTGSAEKAQSRGETKPELVPRLRATSSSSSPGGPVSPKPPVPQGAKPALAARPTIPQKPRTTSTSRSIGTETIAAWLSFSVVNLYLTFIWVQCDFRFTC